MKVITIEIVDGGFCIKSQVYETGFERRSVRATTKEMLQCVEEQVEALEAAETQMFGVVQQAPQ